MKMMGGFFFLGGQGVCFGLILSKDRFEVGYKELRVAVGLELSPTERPLLS